jgi:hypothetical protein
MTIFLEHALHSDEISHFSIDCIPLKFSLLDDLRIFFKKALSEQDTEWSSNKKIIDTTKYKGNMTKILSDKFSSATPIYFRFLILIIQWICIIYYLLF